MQSQRTVREPEREPAVAPSEETAPPRLTPRQEAERRANMTAAISLEQSILSGPPLPAGVVGLVAFNGQQQPPEDASMFAAGRLSILEIHISEDADVAAIQRSGLQRLREEMARYPPDASPVTIKEEGGVITLTNRCFLPFTNDEREELNGLMQSVMNLDSESMAAFHDVYTKLVYYARNFFVSSRGREISFFGAYEEAGGIYEEVAQRSSEVQDLLFSSLRKIAEGRRAEVEVDSVNNAVEQLYSAYYDSAYYRIGYALDRAFGDGQADAADLLDRAQRMGILSQLELGLLGQLVEEYASLSLKISEIKDKIAAYMLGMPEYQAGTTERMALPHGGGEVHLPTQEEREMFLDFMDVCGALALFSARLDFEEAFEPYLRYRDEAYSVHRPEGGTFGIDEWMGRQLQINNLPSDVANAMGRIGELGEFRAKMQGYGAMIANYSRSVLHSDDFVSMVDSRVLQARSEDFSFADEEIRESTRSAETVRGISSYLGSLGGAINSVQALGEEIPGMRKDRELFERFHTGDFWDKLYSYSEYFMRHGAADFLFWSTLAAGAIGAGATLASSVSRGAARVLAADLTELVAGREISVLGVPTAAAAAEAAAPTLLRQSLGFGYRMAADIDLLMGLPVFANAMRYFAGDRSDEVYQDLNLMATFMLMRAGGGGGGFLPRLTSAAGTIAAGTRFKEDIRRGEIWQAIQDGTVTAVGGAMFVRTTAGVLSFADSASASGTGMFATATGTKALDFLRGAATRLAPVGTVLEWGTEAYTAPGFLGIYGFHMINQCVSMWWREVPLPAMDYEGGGFTALREYFSSTYTEGANFMPFMSIAFRTIGAGWSAATSRYWRPTQGLAGISSNGFALVPESLIVPTSNPARTALAARLGAPEVAERLALDAGYLPLSSAGMPTEEALTAIRAIALSEQRLTAEEVLAQLGAENTRAARRWAEQTLNKELDRIWQGADLLASTRPLPSLQSARGRELTEMLERAQNLRDLSIAGKVGGVYSIAAGASALSVSAHLPEAGALGGAQGRFVDLMTTQDMGTNAFMTSLSAGLYSGLGRKPFNLGMFSNFAVTMASLFKDLEAGVSSTVFDEVDLSAYRDIYRDAFPDEKGRMNAIFAIFLSLAAHGRLDPSDAGNPSRFRDSVTSFGDSLKELKGAGFDFSGMGLSDLFFLAEYLSNGGTVADIKDVWMRMGGFYPNSARPLLASSSSEDERANLLQNLEYYRQLQKIIIPTLCYGLENGRDTDWAFAAVMRTSYAVRGAEQLQMWKPEMFYAMLGDSMFASEAAINSIPDDNDFRLNILLIWDNLFRFDPRFEGMWEAYYPGEAQPFE